MKTDYEKDARELSVEEVAIELDIKEQTLRNYICQGTLKAKRYGRMVRILPCENAKLWARRIEELSALKVA